jgi:hypothetical protein
MGRMAMYSWQLLAGRHTAGGLVPIHAGHAIWGVCVVHSASWALIITAQQQHGQPLIPVQLQGPLRMPRT